MPGAWDSSAGRYAAVGTVSWSGLSSVALQLRQRAQVVAVYSTVHHIQSPEWSAVCHAEVRSGIPDPLWSPVCEAEVRSGVPGHLWRPVRQVEEEENPL